MKRWIKRGLLGLLGLLVLAGAILSIWASIVPDPQPEALAALQSDTLVAVTTEPWLTFQPASGAPTTGYIFYPGGKVDPRSYAPAARALAAQGYLVVVPAMRLNLAVLSANRADEIIAAHPGIQRWAIGGHSLGGAMAAQYASAHPDKVAGLVLWAAYPTGDMSQQSIKVASIYGTNDGLLPVSRIEASRAQLPASANFVALEGGNHAQFGWYGAQDGDNPATLTHVEQQEQAVQATLDLLQQLSAAN